MSERPGWRSRRAGIRTPSGAISRIGEQLGINPETLRNWVRQAEIDAGAPAGDHEPEAERIAELERENRELRRANEILQGASAFFAAELDRHSDVVIAASSTRTRTSSGSSRSAAS